MFGPKKYVNWRQQKSHSPSRHPCQIYFPFKLACHAHLLPPLLWLVYLITSRQIAWKKVQRCDTVWVSQRRFSWCFGRRRAKNLNVLIACLIPLVWWMWRYKHFDCDCRTRTRNCEGLVFRIRDQGWPRVWYYSRIDFFSFVFVAIYEMMTK